MRAEKGAPASLNWRLEVPQIVIIVLMFMLAAVTWGATPDSLPVHWNAAGQPDRYGGKFEGLLLLPSMTVGLYLLLLFLPRFDPVRPDPARFFGPYSSIRMSLTGFFAAIYFAIVLTYRMVVTDVSGFIFAAVGLLLILIGRAMVGLPPNSFAGIRTPWTFVSARSWEATHRVAGPIFGLAGIAFVAISLLPRTETVVLIGLGVAVIVLLGGIAGLTVYSYRVWRDDPNHVPVFPSRR